MSITFKDAAKDVSIEKAIGLNNKGIAVIISDGRDVTFKPEFGHKKRGL